MQSLLSFEEIRTLSFLCLLPVVAEADAVVGIENAVAVAVGIVFEVAETVGQLTKYALLDCLEHRTVGRLQRKQSL